MTQRLGVVLGLSLAPIGVVEVVKLRMRARGLLYAEIGGPQRARADLKAALSEAVEDGEQRCESEGLTRHAAC